MCYTCCFLFSLCLVLAVIIVRQALAATSLGMSHADIVLALRRLAVDAGEKDEAYYGTRRIVESLWDLCEHSSEPMMQKLAVPLHSVLVAAETTDNGFALIDYSDTRSTDELTATYGNLNEVTA